MNRRDLLALAPLAPLALGAPLVASPAAHGQPAAPPAPPAPLDAQTAHDELKALLEAQAKQWSSGDLDAFCAHYAEDCLFLSPGGLTRGRKEVLARYKKKYADKAAMGRLTLEVLGATTRADLASVAMQWTLAYAGGRQDTGSSLIALEKRGGRWQIVHDASM